MHFIENDWQHRHPIRIAFNSFKCSSWLFDENRYRVSVRVMRLRGKTNRKYAPLFGRILNIHSTASSPSYNHPFFVAPFIITLQINSNLYYHHATPDDKKNVPSTKRRKNDELVARCWNAGRGRRSGDDVFVICLKGFYLSFMNHKLPIRISIELYTFW